MSASSDYLRVLTDIQQQKGATAAATQRANSAIWGQAVGNLGQIAGGAIQQYSADKQAKREAQKQAEADEKLSALFAGGTMPTASQLITAVGPERGVKIAQGLKALQDSALLDPRVEFEKSQKVLRDTVLGLNALSPEMRAQTYPQIRGHLVQRGIIKPDDAPEQYDENWWQSTVNYGKEPAKTEAERLVAVPGPDGKPVYGVPKAGEPVYEKGAQATNGIGNEVELAYAAAEGDTPEAKAKNALEILKAQKGTAGGANPTEWSVLTAAAGGNKDAQAALALYRRQHPQAEGGQEPLIAVMGPDGKPVLRRRSQAEGMTPASTREQGRPVTSGDANKLTDLDSALSDLAIIDKTLGADANATGIGAQVGAAIPNWATNLTGWGVDAKKKQAVIDRVKQVIGKSLEGGVLRKEDEAKYQKILPTIGDPPPVVKSKLAGLKAAIAQRKSTLLDNLSDAGYETGRFEQRSGQPAKADPLGIR